MSREIHTYRVPTARAGRSAARPSTRKLIPSLYLEKAEATSDVR
jgi:hypothetical protein